jgi:hypothetical protein
VSARPAARSARVKPHTVRGRQLEEVQEKDPDGRIVYHHRTVDALRKMLRAGTIDQAMHDAAKDFQAAFISAQLDPLHALPVLGVPGTGREPELNEPPSRCPAARARDAAGAWWYLEPGRLRAFGTSSDCNAAFGSGRFARGGTDDRTTKGRRREP